MSRTCLIVLFSLVPLTLPACVSDRSSGTPTRDVCGNGLDDDQDGYVDDDDQDCWESVADGGGADARIPSGSDAGPPPVGTDAGPPPVRTHVCLLVEWTADVAGAAHLQGCYGTRAPDGRIICEGPLPSAWSDPLRAMDGSACSAAGAAVSCRVRAPVGSWFDLNGEVGTGRYAVEGNPSAYTLHGTFVVSEDADCNGRVEREVGRASGSVMGGLMVVPLGGGAVGSNISLRVGG